ncbi:MAG: CcoQ/FixQ family Cbb3-type cytochrome c oxidase assembly chaperone [Verrucomicrobiota bacterium]|jgi:hypothetical protein
MEQKVLSSINGVGIYGIISILIFVAFFTITLLWAFGLKKNYLKHMGDLPLDGGEKNATETSGEQNYE